VKVEFLLLLGLIDKSNLGVGWAALETLLYTNGDKQWQQVALDILLNKALTKESIRFEFRSLLEDLIEKKPNHLLIDRFYYLLAQLYIYQGLLDEAEQVIKKDLIERFPGSSLRHNALLMLAYTAWKREPPQYRTLADYLTQFKDELPKGKNKAQVSALVADCYYLNKDYASAASAYDTAIQELEDLGEWVAIGPLLFQMVLVAIELDQITEAQAYLDEKRKAWENIKSFDDYWRAEWNLVSAMQAKGDALGALERMNIILADTGKLDINLALHLRFMWLRAQLAFENEQI